MGLRVCLLGATGTIGRATLLSLRRRGHAVVCFVRPVPGACSLRAMPRPGPSICATLPASRATGSGASGSMRWCPAWRRGPVRPGMPGRWITGCMSTCWRRPGRRGSGASSCSPAICVQRPLLAFQHAKLAFEAALAASGLTYSIVRPTAYFKSLSGQVERVRRGKPFLCVGDGGMTSCKPISDGDLAEYLADCLEGRGPVEPGAADRRTGRGDHAA